MTVPIHPIVPGVSLIELRPPLLGFDAFIGAWLYRGEATCLVDVGPAVTARDLLAALAELGVECLDAICLTHIHIDHAGAIGHVAAAFPETPIIVHPKGIAHLVDPTRLWEGTLKTLGHTARAYGPFMPVPEARFLAAEGEIPGPLTALATPGHAPHHISYLGEAGLFVGEAAGVHLTLPGGVAYLRPATPPRFFRDTYLASLSTAEALQPKRLFYGHFGMTDEAMWLSIHAEQIHQWMAVVAQVWERAGGDADEATAECCLKRLLMEDDHLKGFQGLDTLVQDRERGFLLNSIRGMLGELVARKAA